MNDSNLLELVYKDVEPNEKFKEIIEIVINKCFSVEKLENLNLYISVTLTTPQEIRKINNKFRKIDKETDVLSFPMFEKDEIEDLKVNGNEIEDTLGDIMISVQRVEEQAKEYGHSFEREFSYMLVHGFYHLMGYDHIEEGDRIVMREKEEKVLEILNITR